MPPPQSSIAAPAAARVRLARRRALTLAGGGPLLALAACDVPGSQLLRRSEALSGPFELISQNWPPLNAIHEQSIAAFRERHPQVEVTLTNVGYSEIPTKVRASIAAGAGPDGFFHYSGFWRGVNAPTVMLPLTPQLFRRNELERITYGHLLRSVPAKDDAVYFVPAFVGMGAAGLLYNTSLLQNVAIDPQGFTTLDAILAAATRLVVRDGPAIKRAGLLHAHTSSLVFRWILDQGGHFYDASKFRWNLQTVEAERAMQWLLDLYDKHGVTWRATPEGVRDALGEGHAAMMITGPFSLSGYVKTFPDVRLEDRPLPGFVANKPPQYFEPELAGYSLSALLKPGEMRARIGAAFLRHLLSPDNAMLLANEYSGCILVRGTYEDNRFMQTTFGAVRAKLPEQIISRIVLIPTGANPYDFGAYLNRVIAAELSIRGALAEAQQAFNTQEEEVRRTIG